MKKNREISDFEYKLGGCRNGGYVNNASRSEPTYEFFPSNGAPVYSSLLQSSLPANLYPLTWLLPSGKLLVQSNWQTSLLDYKAKVETPLNDMLDAVRTYPASGGSVMLPLIPENNWTATIMFCGGSNIASEECVTSYNCQIPLMQINRVDGLLMTLLPHQELRRHHVSRLHLTCLNHMNKMTLFQRDGQWVTCCYSQMAGYCASMVLGWVLHSPSRLQSLAQLRTPLGTAGYGNKTWSIGQSYADSPVLTPVVYDPNAPIGQRWSNADMKASTVPRMYHSTALLLADGK